MKVLWIIPKPLTRVIDEFNLPIKKQPIGGWIDLVSERMYADLAIELVVCFQKNMSGSNSYGNKEKIEYYWLNLDHNLESNAQQMLERTQPDIIQIFGSESDFNRRIGHLCCKSKFREKTILWIQGLKYIYAQHFMGGIPPVVQIIPTVRDVIRKDSLAIQQRKFYADGQDEIKLLQELKYVSGRTSWDEIAVKNVNPNIAYIKLNETMRASFYNVSWDITKAESHTIFISQGHYPIKGYHWVLLAMAILKEKYPDIKLLVSGWDSAFVRGLKETAYGRYTRKIIEKNGLSNAVKYVGMLNETEMVNTFLKSKVYVMPSSIENSPNSLGEAMLLGMPIVSSCVGGVNDLLQDKTEGFLYSYDAPYMLAGYIDRIFQDDDMAVSMGKLARTHALKTHNPDVNYDKLLSIYYEIAKK